MSRHAQACLAIAADSSRACCAAELECQTIPIKTVRVTVSARPSFADVVALARLSKSFDRLCRVLCAEKNLLADLVQASLRYSIRYRPIDNHQTR
jgi:hypothetical protein